MPADILFSLLRHPLAIALWLGVLVVASRAMYGPRSPVPPPILPRRLVPAYGLAFALCVLIAAAEAYVSPQEAVAVWHVPAERYREVLVREFVNALAGVMFVAGLGIAFVGVPTIFWLARRGRAQIGWVLMASACISVFFSVLLNILFVHGSSVWLKSLFQLLCHSLPIHLLLSLGFCVGAGLPWRVRRVPA